MRSTMHKTLLPLVVFFAVAALAITAAAKDFLYVPGTNSLVIIDCDTDTIVKTVSYSGSPVASTFSPDGKRFYLNCQRRILVVDTQTDQLVDTYNFWSDLNRVTVNPAFGVSQDGKKLYMACQIVKKKLNIPKLNLLPPQLIVYDTQNKKIVKNFEIPPMCHGVIALRNDPDTLYLFGQDIYTLNLKNGGIETVKGVLHPEEGTPQLNSLVNWDNKSPGDHGLFTNPAYSATFEEMFYVIIDKNTGKLRMLKGEEVLMGYSTSVSPDKNFLYTAMDEVYKVDFKTGKTLAMDPLASGTVYTHALTADGKKLYLGGAGGVSVYDTQTMKLKGYVNTGNDTLMMNRISKKG